MNSASESQIPPFVYSTELTAILTAGHPIRSHNHSGREFGAMPDVKLRQLCEQISKESNHDRLTGLIDELCKLLVEEQDAIKAKINANLGKSLGEPL